MALREGQQAEHLVTGLVERDTRADGLDGARDRYGDVAQLQPEWEGERNARHKTWWR
jgi:hypothetical protein